MPSPYISQEDARQFCIEDFYRSFTTAVERAGGSPVAFNRQMTLRELAETLAQNGVRFTYDRTRSIDNVSASIVPCFMNPPYKQSH
jgi:hypothetical protein